MLRISKSLFRQFSVGDCSKLSRTFSAEDVRQFAELSGDVNSIHVSGDKPVVHGALLLGMFSAIGGTQMPGDGAFLVGIDKLKFHEPVHIDNSVTATMTVTRNLKNKFLLADATIVQDTTDALHVSAVLSLKI